MNEGTRLTRFGSKDGQWEGDIRRPDEPGRTEYAWDRIRPRFLAALQEGDAHAFTFLERYIALLESAIGGILKRGRTGGVVVDAGDCYESLRLLRHWWMPLRQPLPEAGKHAASELRSAVARKILQHAASLQFVLDDPNARYAPAFRESLRSRAGVMAKYQEDEDFVVRAALRMEAFDPRRDTHSPQDALRAAVVETLVGAWERDLGPYVAPEDEELTRAEAIRRALRRPEDDPQRKRFTNAIDALAPEQRDYLYALLRPGGSVKAARHAINDAGGTKEDRIRRKALQMMADALPEIARLPIRDPTRVGRKKAHG